MYDFQLSVPTEIHFGTDCEEKVGMLMKQFADRVLLVYGSERIFTPEGVSERPASELEGKAQSLGQRMVDRLEEAGCTVIRRGGVKPNAEADWIRETIDLARREKVNGILAVGGGSVMDSAKAVAAGVGYDGDILSLYENPEAAPDYFLPVGAVVTIPATASESNEMSVISDTETGRKIARPFRESKPKFALLNPALTVTVSPFQTASGGFDIFAHAFERYFDLRRQSRLFDQMAITLMRQVVELLPQVLKAPEDLALRGEMMVAATVAHNDMLGPGGDFACHEISHVVTEKFGIAHGAALAMIIPAWIKRMHQKEPQRFAEFFRQVFSVEDAEDGRAISEGLSRMEDFVESLGLSLRFVCDSGEDGAKCVLRDTAALACETLGGRPYLGGGLAEMYAEDIAAVYEEFLR